MNPQASRTLPGLRLRLAHTCLRRLRGLLGRRRPLGGHSGLLIVPCRAVHTVGMSYPIAAWFIGRDGRVLQVRRLPPWRWASCRGAVAVVETSLDVLDAEDGGVDRVEAAVKHCASRHFHGNQHKVGE
ncbi:DUF192 domain-containing protein [Bordetella avium]|nr:DUF192 domain-containing protein [Bordetella avium]RIQ68839.1 DUF192 domain-containing protein [Bordetella avium]